LALVFGWMVGQYAPASKLSQLHLDFLSAVHDLEGEIGIGAPVVPEDIARRLPSARRNGINVFNTP
jgi:hypothetical protein